MYNYAYVCEYMRMCGRCVCVYMLCILICEVYGGMRMESFV